MFKASASLLKAAPSSVKRLPLSTKQAANKGGFYKGTRVGSMGWHTKHGKYIIDLRKVRTYVPPIDEDSANWKAQIGQQKLTPFVSKHINPPKDPSQGKKASQLDWAVVTETSSKRYYGELDGQKYLDLWKELYNREVQLGLEEGRAEHAASEK